MGKGSETSIYSEQVIIIKLRNIKNLVFGTDIVYFQLYLISSS